MQGVIRVVSLDRNGLSVNEAVQCERGLKRLYLLDNLRHLAVGERLSVESVDIGVVLKKYVCPVAYQVFFCRILDYAFGIVPAMLLEHGDNGFLEVRFPLVNHETPPSLSLNKAFYQRVSASFNSHR